MFQVMFALENASTATLELPELKMELMPVETETAMFDLTLSLQETASDITGSFEYNTDLFDTSTIKRMARHFQVLLEQYSGQFFKRDAMASASNAYAINHRSKKVSAI
jgi:non-ribosomal peptide synthetase component F